MQQHLEADHFTEKFIFSNKAMFHLHMKSNTCNVCIWETQNQYAATGHVQDSQTVNVFCAISDKKVYRPFFFAESTVTGTSYLDMMQQWLMPQDEDDSDDFIYQQDGTLSHYHHLVCGCLNQHLPQCWIRCMTTEDQGLLCRPPR
jgi:hypothetical protein